jgi:hypothetical protein
MTYAKREEMTVTQLIEYFKMIALDQYDAILDEDNDKYNRLFDDMEGIRNELKRRDGDQRRALISLFKHPNRQVRLKAAISTLAIEPDAARQVLQTISDRNEQPQAMDARLIMKSLDAGPIHSNLEHEAPVEKSTYFAFEGREGWPEPSELEPHFLRPRGKAVVFRNWQRWHISQRTWSRWD